MEATYYIPKEIESIPLHDKKTDEFMMIVGGEEVNVPGDLFRKIFKEYEPPIAKQIVIPVGEMTDDYLENVYFKSQSFKFGKQLIKDFGFSKKEAVEQFKDSMCKYSFLTDEQKEKAMESVEKIVNRMYEDIEKE